MWSQIELDAALSEMISCGEKSLHREETKILSRTSMSFQKHLENLHIQFWTSQGALGLRCHTKESPDETVCTEACHVHARVVEFASESWPSPIQSIKSIVLPCSHRAETAEIRSVQNYCRHSLSQLANHSCRCTSWK